LKSASVSWPSTGQPTAAAGSLTGDVPGVGELDHDPVRGALGDPTRSPMSRKRMPGSGAMQTSTWAWLVKKRPARGGVLSHHDC